MDVWTVDNPNAKRFYPCPVGLLVTPGSDNYIFWRFRTIKVLLSIKPEMSIYRRGLSINWVEYWQRKGTVSS